MEYSFELCFLFGDIFLTEDKNGCALLLRPDKKKITWKSLFEDITLAFAVLGLKNVKKAMAREARIKKGPPNGFIILTVVYRG